MTVFDCGINTEDYVSFVATNNYEAGAPAANKLAEIVGSRGKIAVVKMIPGSASTTQREMGFEDTISKQFPEIQVVAEQYCMSDRAKALAVTENMLTAHPDLDGIFGSAEPATVGVAQALKSRGQEERVKFVGFDFSDSIEKDLKAGVVDALVVQDPFHIGYTAVKTLVAKLNGQTPEKRINSPATVVTVEDLSRPEIDALLHSNLDKYLD